jgi:hypothetical protein
MVKIVSSGLELLFGKVKPHGYCKNLDSARRVEKQFTPHKGQERRFTPLFMEQRNTGYAVFLEAV